MYFPHLFLEFEGLMEFFYYVAYVEDIDEQNDEHVDLVVDEDRCFKKGRSFSGRLATQETAKFAPASYILYRCQL